MNVLIIIPKRRKISPIPWFLLVSLGFSWTQIINKLQFFWNNDQTIYLIFQYLFLVDSAVSSGGNVLVHCLGGISRSSTIIIAYLMLKLGYNLNDAYDYVKSKKSNIAPNFNFMGQLLDFEKSRNVPQTPFTLLPCSVSPGLFSDNSSMSTSSVESNTSYWCRVTDG